MHPYLLLPAAACLVCSACAGVVFLSGGRGRAGLLGTVLYSAAAWWALCQVVWNSASEAQTALLWMRLSAPGWAFFGPLMLHIFLETSEEPSPRLRRLLPAFYASAAVSVTISWFTPWMLRDATRTSWGWVYSLGPLYAVYFAVTMVAVGCALYLAGRMLSGQLSPAERRQRPWVILGIAIPLGASSLTDGILPMLGIPAPSLGTTAFAVLGSIAVHNIVHYGYSLMAPGGFSDEILDNLSDGVALLDPRRRVRRANEGLAKLIGRPEASLVGTRIDELLPESDVRELETSEGLNSELRRTDGPPVPIFVSSTLLRDRQDHAIGQLLVLRDLREVEALRSRLVVAARLAAVGELASGMAHEINNPMAFVRANLNQLDEHWKALAQAPEAGEPMGRLAPVIAEGRELIEESLDGVARTAEIVQGVQSFAQTGNQQREFVDVNRMLDALLHMASTQLRWRATIELHAGDLPVIWGEVQELKQVFLNLIVNAGHAIDDGGSIRLHTELKDEGVLIHVEDDGCGIDPEVRERIFDPFFTTRGVGEGTGLGLSIAYQIVHRHGGEIRVETEPGTGSRFSVYLPVKATS